MKKVRFLSAVLTATILVTSIIAFATPFQPVSVQAADSESPTEIEQDVFSKIHIPFIENQGQIEPEVRFYATTFAGTFFVSDDHMTYTLVNDFQSEEYHQGIAIKERFLTEKTLHPTGLDKNDAVVNYFVGEEYDWRSNIPTYNTVGLNEIWPSIDVVLRAYDNNIEKIFKVSPGGSVDNIRLALEGVRNLSISEDGELLLETEIGTFAMTKPLAFQYIDGLHKTVDASYIVDDNTYGFAVDKYDPHYDLVIDPLLASTFIGGSHNEIANAIALDSSGNVFVTGLTFGGLGGTFPDYPATTGAFDTTPNGNSDVFISKLSSDLSTLLASTYIGQGFVGAEGKDEALDIAIDSTGNVFVTGFTIGPGYPTTSGAFDRTWNTNGDVFITKLNNDLSTLLASTYLGSAGGDEAFGIAIDSFSNVFVTGVTQSTDFPTTGALDTTHNGVRDVFISKLSSDLSTLLASTYIGGGGNEGANDITFDSSGNVLVTGRTASSNFPTTSGAFDTNVVGGCCPEGFVSKLDNNLSTLLASTFLGARTEPQPHAGPNAIVLDNSNNVFVTGTTSLFGGNIGDVAISKLDSNLSSLLAYESIGGSFGSTANDIALDSSGNIFITGRTFASDFPITPGAFQTTLNLGGNTFPRIGIVLHDAFISKLDNNLSTLLASTFLGGGSFAKDFTTGEEGDDKAFGIVIDNSNNVFVTGLTASRDFPTTSQAFDTTHNGVKIPFLSDVFISKFSSDLAAVPPEPVNQPPVCDADGPYEVSEGSTFALDASRSSDPDGTISSFEWDLDNDGQFDDATGSRPSIVFGDNGSFTVGLRVTDDFGDSTTCTAIVNVSNLPPRLTLDTSDAISFPGDNAFLGSNGVEQTHSASATDPGSDDLTFSWSFGAVNIYFNDGRNPDPPNSPEGIFPFSITDTGITTFTMAGLFTITINVADDDGGSSSDGLAKVVTDNKDCTKSQGFWKHQFGKGKHKIDEATLQSYLDIVNFASGYFSESVPASTLEEAGSVFKPSRGDNDDEDRAQMRDKVEMQLLAAWLNFAKGGIGWGEPIDTDGDGLVDTPFSKVISDIELILLDSDTTHQELERAKDLAEAVNLHDEDNEVCEEEEEDAEVEKQDDDDSKKKKVKKGEDDDDDE